MNLKICKRKILNSNVNIVVTLIKVCDTHRLEIRGMDELHLD